MLTRAEGLNYLEVLAGLHKALEPELYLEIGTQKGRSLRHCRSRAIAIDPDFQLETKVVTDLKEVTLVQDTSDAFFAGGAAERLIDRPIDFAFLDGMHLFEYLLRDFINTEKYAAQNAMVMLHDCLPWNANMAARDRSIVETRAWSGDVWKVVDILDKYRPDLEVTVLDAAPTGLVAVQGLNPDSAVLSQQYDAIVAEYMDVEIDEADPPACMRLERRVSAEEFPALARVRPIHVERVSQPRTIAIKTAVPRPRMSERWGDHHFAVGLQAALRRQGHTVRVDSRKTWDTEHQPNEIDLVIRGRAAYGRKPSHLSVAWIISHSEKVKLEEASAYDLCFAAGEPVKARLANSGACDPVLLPQAFDADRMYPPADPLSPRSGVFFAGIARSFDRPAVEFAVATQQPLTLFGAGWEKTDAAPYHEGVRVLNSELGGHYRAAEVVLNDHTPGMRSEGVPSNRIFDALACGAPVVSDAVAWLPDDLRHWVYFFDDEASFSDAVEQARNENDKKRKARHDFAMSMKYTHSFDARAADITAALQKVAVSPQVEMT